MTRTGCYLYAITRGISSSDLVSMSGIRDAPVRLVEHRGLRAVVSDVDLEEFGEAGLRRHLEDLGWLEEVARRHHAVVHEAASKAPTAPLRLATIYLDDNAVRARLDEWHDALQRTLRRIEGRTEWSVKAFASSIEAEQVRPSSDPSGAGGGAAYLMRRRQAVAQREAARHAGAVLADELHRALSQHAVASRRLPPQDRKLTGHTSTMTLNGAYLIDDHYVDTFRASAQALSEEHPEAHLVVRGPWPPYSFATLEDV